jgi:hypothetical protein
MLRSWCSPPAGRLFIATHLYTRSRRHLNLQPDRIDEALANVVESNKARIQTALNIYDRPNTIFGRKPTAYIRSRRPKPPKVTRRPDGEGLDYRRGHAWRAQYPLGPAIEAKGSLAALQLDGIAAADLERTERLLKLLVSCTHCP